MAGGVNDYFTDEAYDLANSIAEAIYPGSGEHFPKDLWEGVRNGIDGVALRDKLDLTVRESYALQRRICRAVEIARALVEAKIRAEREA